MTGIFDLDGNERDATWLAATYDGCEVLPARIPADVTEYWQLAAVYCTTGPATLKAEVRRGLHPDNNQPVVMTWPELTNPSQELPTLPANQHNWARRGVIQRTEASGITGFGLGGAYGPFYHVWILSSVPSDCLSKAGMKGGTNHDGPLHGVWVLTPVAPVYASLEAALLGTCDDAQLIQFNQAAALQKRIFADGFVPNSPEVDVLFGGIVYRAQRAQHLASGEVRAYFCRLDDWENVRYVVRPVVTERLLWVH